MYSVVFAQLNQQIVNDEPSTFQDIEKVFANIVSAAIPAAGVVLFIFLMYASLKYISAGDDPKKVSEARSMITYAILGVVLVAMSYLILAFVSQFTGIRSILDFKVTQ